MNEHILKLRSLSSDEFEDRELLISWNKAITLADGDEAKANTIFKNMLSMSKKKKKKHRKFSQPAPKPLAAEVPATEQKPEPESTVQETTEPEPVATAPEVTAPEATPDNTESAPEPVPESTNDTGTEPNADDESDDKEPEPDLDEEAEQDMGWNDEDEDDDEDEPKTGKRRTESEETPDWWENLSDEEQDDYLDDHPHSKLVKTADAENDDSDAPSWWLKLSADQQRDHLKKHPEDDHLKVIDNTVSVKKIAKKIWHKRRAKAASTLSKHRTGLSALATLLSGGEVDRRDMQQAKSTAVLGTKLVLGALAGIALFAFAGPLVPIVASLFLQDSGAGGMSESSDQDQDDIDKAGAVMDKIHTWLLDQDIDELKKRISDYKGE